MQLFRGSPLATAALLRVQEVSRAEQVALLFKPANDTRWNSKLYMLRRCLELLASVRRLQHLIAAGTEEAILNLSDVVLTPAEESTLRQCEPVRQYIYLCRDRQTV